MEPANWTAVNDSFVPYGASSVFVGAGTVFFSYLGECGQVLRCRC